MLRNELGAALIAAAMLIATMLNPGAAQGARNRDPNLPVVGPQAPAAAQQTDHTEQAEPGAPAAAPAAAGEIAPGQTEVERRLAALDRLRTDRGLGIQPAFVHVNDAENLRALFRRMRDLIRAGQLSRANQLGASLLPDENRLRRGLRDDVPPTEIARILELEKDAMPPKYEDLYTIFNPDRAASVVRLYRATTEELISNPRDTAARVCFPKLSHQTAKEKLRPGVTWYIVELALPGADEGFRYHLIFFDGQHWTMLGPIWNN